MEREVDAADLVLVICTPNYHERYQQEGDPNRGLGGRWESSLIRDSLYANGRELERFIPVLTKLSTAEDIPLSLRHRATHYRLDDYESLYRHITRQWKTPPSPLGEIRMLRDVPPEVDVESDKFHLTITERFRELDRIAERLTNEQYEVITRLRGTPRALIAGTAGSGKTLVATEKAIRLSSAGVETLFLCHNPLLADWVEQLVRDSGVAVRPFEDFVRDLATVSDGHAVPWSNYSQPPREQLQAATAALEASGPPFGAVIVDEGQDFAEDWWPVVERCVPPSGTLYVFFDEQQSLIPNRLSLPALGWPSTLSRNCRNSGRIYDVMRRLAPIRELPEADLEGLGEVAFFARPAPRESVDAALRWLEDIGATRNCTAVLGGGVAFDGSVLADKEFQVTAPFEWQEAVRQQFRRCVNHMRPLARGEMLNADHAIARLAHLSEGSVPTADDRAVVSTLAAELMRPFPRKRLTGVSTARWQRIADAQQVPGVLEWRLNVSGGRVDGIHVLEAFRTDLWAEGVAPPRTVRFAPHAFATTDEIPVFSIGEIKGLERDAVLLVLQGDAPQLANELFVGVSRARSVLATVMEPHNLALLPSRLRAQAR
jgi:hypothetical protein